MLNEFYNYIANNTLCFFQSKGDALQSGERYCLKLDTEEMVVGVDDALRNVTSQNNIQGSYSYGDVYSTFTLKISENMQVVVAAKRDGMTDDFLATLRNAELTENRFPRDFISYVENKAAEESTEIVFDISDQSFYQLTLLLGNGLMNAQGNMLQNMATCQKGIAKIDEIDSYLSVDIDEKVLSKTYKKIKTLEQEIIEHEASLEIAKKQRTGLNGDVMRATSEYNRFVENMLSNLESDDDNGRILKYAHHATQALAEYKIRLQKKKIGTLAETMTKCYKQLANKKNLISRIDMDAVTLDFVYLNADNQIVPKESLSAGEKQLMVISLLWALAICSKKKLPVIIDTPLSRMDSVHRVALIKTYFPNASDQTIILSTDSEIDKHYYEIMKDTVGDEFTLVYDDELKCSKIKKGYFLGD